MSINAKKIKLIRRLCQEFKLNYTLWKHIYSEMTPEDQEKFLADAYKNLARSRRQKLGEQAREWVKKQASSR